MSIIFQMRKEKSILHQRSRDYVDMLQFPFMERNEHVCLGKAKLIYLKKILV